MRARPVLAAAAAALMLVGCSPSPDDADDGIRGTVTVLAAASLTEVFDELAIGFQAAHPGVEVVLSFGGSGALAEQILAGVPAGVFAAADERVMQRVVDASAAVDPVTFATNTLELVVPVGNPGGVRTLSDLARPELAVAVCDPTVPCGSAAATLLDRAGVSPSVDTFEPDVRAVLTKVTLGEVDAGLVYRTEVIAAGAAVEGIRVASAAAVVNRYQIAVPSEAPNAVAAHAFVEYVLSYAGRAALREAGFGVP